GSALKVSHGAVTVACGATGVTTGRCAATLTAGSSGRARGARATVLGRGSAALKAGRAKVRVKLTRVALRKLRRVRKLSATLTLTVMRAGGPPVTGTRAVSLRR